MARAENIKMIERHVEKLVLAVCLLALVLASWHWLFSSPTKLSIFDAAKGRTVLVPPMDADAKILDSAAAVKKMYFTSKISIPPVPAWGGRLNDQRAMSPLPATPTNLAGPRRPIGLVEPPTRPVVIGIKELIAAMPAPAKPVVRSSVELPKRPPPADLVLACGLSSYAMDALGAAWKEIIKAVPFEQVVPYKVIVEVQQAPADGDWSKATPVLVQSAPLNAAGEPIVLPEIPDFDGKNIAEVRKARDAVLAMQQRILQPSYLPVWRSEKQWVQPEMPATPEVATQPAKATIAFFDDAIMKIGPAYRYRVQLVVINPLLTYDEALAKDRQAEARQKFLTSKPSEWSDPVSAHREVYFFLTGANTLNNKMTVTVYARQWGQWAVKSFEVQEGEFIGGVENVDMLDPMGEGKKSTEVNFSTGCVVLRLDFKKTLPRKGFGFNFTTPELLYLDAQGKLQSRFKAWDDTSDHRKKLEGAARNVAQK